MTDSTSCEPPAGGRHNAVAERVCLTLAVAAALLAGLYGRFKGLGTWPLGVDEFYLSRSIDNILASGLPAFPCGGYYTRGLVYQYLVAGLRLCGWTPEFAGRCVAALSNLALLPAAFLIAKRVQASVTSRSDPALAAWLVVIILSVSVWEIEMARFARMYAPFQAVFAWYLVVYLRFATTRRGGALLAMAALSIAGVLIWEGGVLLGVANLFAVLATADRGRLARRDWLWLAALSVVLGLLDLGTHDLRIFADMPATAAVRDAPATPGVSFAAWFAPLTRQPLWGLLFALPLYFSVGALRWVAGHRARIVPCAALCLALIAAAAHAFLAATAILAVLCVLRLVDGRELAWARARAFWLALGTFFLVWTAVAAAAPSPGLRVVVQRLFGFPDVYDHVVRVWLRTDPGLSTGLALAFGYLCWHSATLRAAANPARAAADGRPPERPDAVALLLGVSLVLVFAVGATPTDRMETRYTFFLYPVLLILAVHAILRAFNGRRRLTIALSASLPLLCFAATEDFQPRHLLNVDTEKVNYRVDMSPHRVEHYYPRNDIRGVAQYLSAQVRPGDVVITGIPSLDEYYPRIDYVFLDDTDLRYEAYVCPDDRTERWTNRPVLFRVASLTPLLGSHHRIYASVFAEAEHQIKDYAATAGWSVTRVWTANSRTSAVLLIEAAPGRP